MRVIARQEAAGVSDHALEYALDSIRELVLPSPGEGLARLSSGEQARLYVLRLIFDGVLRQGQRLPQDAIAAALGVSRIPLREALIALEQEGWVTIVKHHGVFVGSLDESVVRDHYELYGLFYGFAARRATERQGGVELARNLAPIQKRIAGAGEDLDEMFHATLAFHRVVVTAAQSPRIGSVLALMTGLVPGNFFELVPGTAALEKLGTAAVVREVRRENAEGAAAKYAAMLGKQGDLVVELFRRKGLFDEPAAP